MHLQVLVLIVSLAGLGAGGVEAWRNSSTVEGSCKPITARTCSGSGVIHRYTNIPIQVPYGPGPSDFDVYQTQQEAMQAVRQYLPLLGKAAGCREFLRPFMCAVYLPSCDRHDSYHEFTAAAAVAPPCRDLCEVARSRCRRIMRHVSLNWPPQFDCSRFPTSTEDQKCISGLTIGHVVMSIGSSSAIVDEAEVRVPCTYDLSPSQRPQWYMPDGSLVPEDAQQRLFTIRTSKRSTTLVIQRYRNDFDGFNYTCRAGRFEKVVALGDLMEPQINEIEPTCEPIQTQWWCKSNVGFNQTQLPNIFGMTTQEEIANVLERFNAVVRSGCSRYLGLLLCGTYLSRCNVNATDRNDRSYVCREVCERVAAECADELKAAEIPAPPCEGSVYQTEGECYNGIEIGPVKVTKTDEGRRLEVECYHAPRFWPVWITPNATMHSMPVVSEPWASHVTIEQEGGNVNRLVIHDPDPEDVGIYTCSDGDAFSRNITIDGLFAEPEVPSSCEDIRVPACSVGIGYTSTYVPSLVGLTQDEVDDTLRFMDIFLSNPGCGAYFRSYMCSLYLPPCREKAVMPCQELCLKAMDTCAESLAGSPFEDAIVQLRLTCSSLPSETNTTSQCYNVNEIEIGDVTTSGPTSGPTEVTVQCTFNLHPPFQPIWQDQQGSVITSSDPIDRVHVINSPNGITTTLVIRDFDDESDSGIYTCVGQTQDTARTTVIGNMPPKPSATLDPGSQTAGPVDNSSCEDIKVPACSVGIGYTSTYVPSLVGLTQDDVGPILQAMDIFLSNPGCGTYLRPYMCSLYLPPCREEAVVPCQELCLKAMDNCAESLAGSLFEDAINELRSSCPNLPSETNTTIQCYNVNEIEIGDVTTSGPTSGPTEVTVQCTFNLHPPFQPIWQDQQGSVITSSDPIDRIHVINAPDGITTTLVIRDFDDESDSGIYTCVGKTQDTARTTVIGNMPPEPSATLDPGSQTAGPVDKSSCEEIRVPACSIGTGYTSTYVPSLVGLDQDEVAGIFDGLQIILNNPCSAYFRPYMCSLYLPPCREQAVLPCQELCLKAVETCAETLSGAFSPVELSEMREGCSSMPSETDPTSTCHNVNEVEIGDVGGVQGPGPSNVTYYTVDCKYNLIPVSQPRWFDPAGKEISSGFWRRIRVIEISGSITRLEIANYLASRDGGSYTCAGQDQTVSVDL